MEDELLDTSLVARTWGIAEVTLRKWRILGVGPPFMRLGRAVRYRRADLDAFLSSRAFRNTTEADVAASAVEAAQ
ncbi:helix-turn-helix transcriptional regulator [Phenylobacterium sp.]|jgi:hypothetical protein|uniref:helix-turn-helix transcriptional regulator n=1 Tax=Phenylobacterium sp. TaxID=1871053 RepID=UPI0037C7397A